MIPEGVPSGACLATKKRKEKQTGMPGDTNIRGSQIRVKSKEPIQLKCKSGTFVFFSFFSLFLSLSFSLLPPFYYDPAIDSISSAILDMPKF